MVSKTGWGQPEKEAQGQSPWSVWPQDWRISGFIFNWRYCLLILCHFSKNERLKRRKWMAGHARPPTHAMIPGVWREAAYPAQGRQHKGNLRGCSPHPGAVTARLRLVGMGQGSGILMARIKAWWGWRKATKDMQTAKPRASKDVTCLNRPVAQPEKQEESNCRAGSSANSFHLQPEGPCAEQGTCPLLTHRLRPCRTPSWSVVTILEVRAVVV